MNQPPDPFAGLDGWARSVERRETRALSSGRRRRRWGRRLIVLVVIGAAVGISWGARGDLTQWRPDAAAYPTQSPPAGAQATTTPAGRAKRPFEGTPAESYAEGERGIVDPPLVAVAGFSDQQVTDAIGAVRRAMVAGRLDPRMIVQRDPSAYLGLLAPRAREQIEPWFATKSAANLATRVADGSSLAQYPPRVRGTFSYLGGTTEHGVPYIELTTNYVWVYPWANDAGVFLAHDEVKWRVYDPGRVAPADRGLWVSEARSYLFGEIDCGRSDGLVGLRRAADVTGGVQPGDEKQYYDPNRSLELEQGC
ncbi:hypothetical protein [Virgisporangium aliadipatigenens]|uniref:hypothetical protein n=1 Tax=Virgisporangium aliadipatigenens TaxID=741659 RepID=UPI00194157D6|nr:hypothetical protein [Virgisporangium aliadipatigenens]